MAVEYKVDFRIDIKFIDNGVVVRAKQEACYPILERCYANIHDASLDLEAFTMASVEAYANQKGLSSGTLTPVGPDVLREFNKEMGLGK